MATHYRAADDGSEVYNAIVQYINTGAAALASQTLNHKNKNNIAKTTLQKQYCKVLKVIK